MVDFVFGFQVRILFPIGGQIKKTFFEIGKFIERVMHIFEQNGFDTEFGLHTINNSIITFIENHVNNSRENVLAKCFFIHVQTRLQSIQCTIAKANKTLY